jgi:RNA polymerase-binding transcription factor DksA
MTSDQLELYRRDLLASLARLRADVSQLADEALREGGGTAGGNLSHLPQHLADLASDAFEEDTTLGLLESQEQTLAETRAALARIDQGSYGHCEECQQEIPAERLRTLPYTRHCVACAQRVQEGAPVDAGTA